MFGSMAQRLIRLVLLAALLAVFVSANTSALAAEETISDEWCGFTVNVGQPWKRAALSGYCVPGAIRSAWAAPKGSSIVIFLQEPGSAFSPRYILDLSAKAQKDQLGAAVSVAEVRSVADMKAMWLVVTGKGTGSAIDGKGTIETTQHWVAVPRERDVVIFLLTSATTEYAGLQKSFELAIKSVKLTGNQTAEQKAAR